MAATGRQPDFMGELKGGLAYAWGNGPVRTMIIAFTVLFIGAGATNSLGIFIVRQTLGLSEAALVLPATAMPLASGIAALTIGAAARKLRRAPLLVALALFLAAAGIGMQAGAPTLAWVVAGASGQPPAGAGRVGALPAVCGPTGLRRAPERAAAGAGAHT